MFFFYVEKQKIYNTCNSLNVTQSDLFQTGQRRGIWVRRADVLSLWSVCQRQGEDPVRYADGGRLLQTLHTGAVLHPGRAGQTFPLL